GPWVRELGVCTNCERTDAARPALSLQNYNLGFNRSNSAVTARGSVHSIEVRVRAGGLRHLTCVSSAALAVSERRVLVARSHQTDGSFGPAATRRITLPDSYLWACAQAAIQPL
ncbi:MAG TPA: hypothetical protein VKP30_08935, partial [Polyangiaceae bacterium]|nr:hypothetical protein [Polyangiaceae bacterium]